MTTLKAIGFTVLGGASVLSVTLVVFSVALKYQSTNIAPRCTARPPQTIYNPHVTATTSSSSSSTNKKNPSDHVQYRGGWIMGWVPWVMSLTDEQLLRGVPGTGTRQGGLQGTLLTVTLDGIVLLRFHKFGRKVAQCITLLCLLILMPLYLTAPCLPDFYQNNHTMSLYECNATSYLTVKTSFRQTTLSHVPDLKVDDNHDETTLSWSREYRAIVFRLYITVGCLWIITLYAFRLLKTEWIELLALRRIYYLERRTKESRESSQEWNARIHQAQEEQEETLQRERRSSSAVGGLTETTGEELNDDDDDDDDQETRSIDGDDDDIFLTHRPPWIPHPEQPDTVSNVEPYSVLLGHVPLPPPTTQPQPSQTATTSNTASTTLPNDYYDPGSTTSSHRRRRQQSSLQQQQHQPIATSDQDAPDVESAVLTDTTDTSTDGTTEAVLTRRDCVQWQLQFLIYLLEHALPQEPGYTSPIAAITMIPSAQDVGTVWRKWYTAAAKVRRLQFIQQQIRHRRRAFHNNAEYVQDPSMDSRNISLTTRLVKLALEKWSSSSTTIGVSRPARKANSTITSHVKQTRRLSPYFQQVVGQTAGSGDNDIRLEVASFGPEQTAMYSREWAQSASPCCPYGCLEDRVKTASMDELLDLEEDVLLQLHKCNQDLQHARAQVLTMPVVTTLTTPTASIVTTATGEEVTDNGSIALDIKDEKSVELSDISLRRVSSATGGDGVVRRSVSVCSGDTDPDENDINGSAMSRRSEWVRLTTTNGESGLGSSMHTLLQTAPKATIATRIRDMADPRWWWMIYHEVKSKKWRLAHECADRLTRESSFAVVTFTSRQAAAAARNTLASASPSSPLGQLFNLYDIPIPPLADAAPCTLFPCRYFCRPVTVGMSDMQKNFRFYLVLGWLGLMYIFYTIPLTFATSQVDKDTIAYLFPEHSFLSRNLGIDFPELISGVVSSIVWSAFFMLCPQFFKMIAYFGSKGTSMAQAERRAMQYFWWFMVLTAFTGPMLAYWILGTVTQGQKLGDGLHQLLSGVAEATPTVISANWLNWIIYRFTFILPINFLLQFNTFMFAFLGCNCCSRLTIGGGPGGPVPYRIFVDSGVVLMCAFALAPASPLVAPAAWAYFAFCEPLLRRNLIFVYRPRYDDGGLRWIFVFDMIISALVVGQIMLALQMKLKHAYGPGLIATAAIPVTIWYQWSLKRKYDPAFENTALLRTSLLDGSESLDDMTMKRREEHRRFLVDAHKAAYVPVCIAGTETANFMTSEPAQVVRAGIDSDSGSGCPKSPRGSTLQRHSYSDDPTSNAASVATEDSPTAGLGWLDSIDQEEPASPFDNGLPSLFRGSAPQKKE